MIGPTTIPGGDGGRAQDIGDDDNVDINNINNNNNRRVPMVMTTLEERERSQRILRLLMMMLMLLILMDGEQEPNRNNRQFHETVPYLRSGIKSVFIRGKLDGLWSPLSIRLFEQRRDLDRKVHDTVIYHPRTAQLIELNHNRNEEQILRESVLELIQRSFHVDDVLIQTWQHVANRTLMTSITPSTETSTVNPMSQQESSSKSSSSMIKKSMVPDSTLVYYYPKNSTGFYRGYWRRIDDTHSILKAKKIPTKEKQDSAIRNRDIGVYMIPRYTDRIYNFSSVTDSLISQYDEVLAEHDFEHELSDIALNMHDGYIKIQLLSRPVPAMDELSLVDGFVKIFDGNYTTFSSSNGLLLRVRGVVIHSIGKISLVANDGLRNDSALVLYGRENEIESDEDLSGIDDNFSIKMRRRLESLQENLGKDRQQLGIKNIRDDALAWFSDLWNDTPVEGGEWRDFSSDWNQQMNALPSRTWDNMKQWFKPFLGRTLASLRFPRVQDEGIVHQKDYEHTTSMMNNNRKGSRRLETAMKDITDVLKPNTIRVHEPFVPDNDQMETLEVSPMGRLSSHEKELFLNGINCDFEMNFYVDESQWTIAEWRRSLYMAALRVIFASPSVDMKEYDVNSTAPLWMGDFFLASDIGKKSRTGNLVMSFSGMIESPNCGFYSKVQADALRIDWDRAAGKAVSYSFYMVILCVFEIVLYVQQLLHSQSQSSASRVSVIGIAWHTIIDAMICVGHLLFSVFIQPLFTAFAMISFFKLLIFSVIEMKYMAMILHARSGADNNAASNRRRVGWLHCRFYASLVLGSIATYLIGKENLTVAFVLLYSFWLPQIFLNIITQANKPLHRNFIYGMSLTRLFVPMYIFGIPNSYIHDIEPEFPVNGKICVALLLWVGFQAFILFCQNKFGSRFMIPSIFLPPKYNYHREIPQSLIQQHAPSNGLSALDNDDEVSTALLGDNSQNTGPRNRMKSKSKSGIHEIFEAGLGPAVDCVICYNSINVTEPKSYMLAPCDHIFHTECMTQWMAVKMECPICRMDLPPE